MATIKIVLDQRRAKNDETFPVVIRVRHLKKYFDVKTNYHSNCKKFDPKEEENYRLCINQFSTCLL
jgi:hypothetical protein